ncbi:MAG: carbon-nitrogen hydrolase family protein [Clostridia bacterium]
MSRYLNVGMIQSAGTSMDFETCLARIHRDVDNLMIQMNKPELIVGVEMAIGRFWSGDETEIGGDPIPGKVTEELSKIAKQYGIYFIPGSMLEVKESNGETLRYNSIPIFNPQGELIDVYRKMCPYYPVEDIITPGREYCTFDIKEKNIKIGVLNCHDWCFPEISRNLALMGAEVLIKPAIDPEGLYEICKSIPRVRALENQAYFISMNMTGEYLGSYAYGHSVVCGPDGMVLYEAGSTPASLTMTLDIDRVRDARRYGTCYTDQFLRQLKFFNPPMPYANNWADAPVYKTIPDHDKDCASREADFRENKIMNICK